MEGVHFDRESVLSRLKVATRESEAFATPQQRLRFAMVILEPMRWERVDLPHSQREALLLLFEGVTGTGWYSRDTPPRDPLTLPDEEASRLWEGLLALVAEVESDIEKETH